MDVYTGKDWRDYRTGVKFVDYVFGGSVYTENVLE